MHLAKRMFIFPLFFLMFACGNPVAPSGILALDPKIVHMKVGDSQVFSVNGGRSTDYEFVIPYDAKPYFNMEQVTNHQMKMTLVRMPVPPRYGCDCIKMSVSSTGRNPQYTVTVSSDIYFQR